MRAPFTIFGQTRDVVVEVYVKGKKVEGLEEWDEEMWVERGEDWYGLMSFPDDKRVRIIQRDKWLNAPPTKHVPGRRMKSFGLPTRKRRVR